MADEQAVLPKIELEYAFSVRIFFKERVEFETPRGGRGYTPPSSGEVWGPRLQGKVVPYSGADYAIFQNIRETGIKINTHYMLQADDGAWIYIRNLGYLHRLPLYEGTEGGRTYFRMTPYFAAPKGPHDWMTRTIFVGTAARRSNPDHSLFTYYAVK
jgi:Protein of unknown function (DUF3237)